MADANTILKRLLLGMCGHTLSHTLRKFYLSRQIRRNRDYTEPEFSLLPSLIAGGYRVADIGANVGVYTKEFSSLVGKDGIVYSFEPLPENYDILKTVIAKTRLTNVQSFRTAIGAQTGTFPMIIPDFGTFEGYYQAHLAHPNERGMSRQVEVQTLDNLWKRNIIEQLDFIKCDVEGAELQVIRGGIKIIESGRPGWLLEVCRETSKEVFSHLKELGYKAFVLDGHLRQTDDYRDKEFSNYFFFHPRSATWPKTLARTAH